MRSTSCTRPAFALADQKLATDLSALLALAAFAIGCYAMARCFDLPVVPSALAAQSCIVLFAPTLSLLSMPTNFAFTPGDAVVYAPYLPVLGLLARLEPTSWRCFALTTARVFALLSYSIVAEGIGLNPHYQYLVADWPYLKPYLADDFERPTPGPCATGRSYSTSTRTMAGSRSRTSSPRSPRWSATTRGDADEAAAVHPVRSTGVVRPRGPEDHEPTRFVEDPPLAPKAPHALDERLGVDAVEHEHRPARVHHDESGRAGEL